MRKGDRTERDKKPEKVREDGKGKKTVHNWDRVEDEMKRPYTVGAW